MAKMIRVLAVGLETQAVHKNTAPKYEPGKTNLAKVIPWADSVAF